MAQPQKPRVKLNQNDLRSLMKERRISTSAVKKIESPLAKYDSLGRLLCIICCVNVKSEALWGEHISSKIHKENMIKKMKRKTQADSEVASKIMKSTSHSSTEYKLEEKQYSQITPTVNKILPNDLKAKHETNTTVVNNSAADVSKHKNSLLQDYLSSSESEDEKDDDEFSEHITPKNTVESGDTKSDSNSNLPADFFDNAISSSATVSNAENSRTASLPEKNENTAKSSAVNKETLPEGFFDDPFLDAKARKVEYKDPIEEEYEKFKKVMAEESNLSQNITEEEEEKSQFTRDIEEIDQQIQYWERVKMIQEKCEETRKCINSETESANDNSDMEVDNENIEDDILTLDWRYFKG